MTEHRYDIHVDEKFGQLTTFDADAEAALHVPWFNETLTHVDDSVVRLGVVQGEFHWHKHDEQDEFFFVLDGELTIELEGMPSVRLERHHGFTVPKGVVHKPSTPVRTVILMVESAGVQPTGD